MSEHNTRTKCTECKLILWDGSSWIECGFGERRGAQGGTEGGLMVATEKRGREKSMWGGGGGMWDVVIARPIHHAMPAGMRWGQSRTTQLQPVLVCCARLHCVPTMFCCLLLDFLCSSSLVFPSACFSSRLCSVRLCSVAAFSSLPLFFPLLCYIIFELDAQAITKWSAAGLWAKHFN